MILEGLEICCPQCHGGLDEDGAKERVFRCGQCDKNYPVIFGIPDLRVFPDPYISIEADRKKGLRVVERFADLDFAGIIDYYYSITPAVPPRHAQLYRRGLLAGEARARANLAAWQKEIGLNGMPVGGPFLEIGCGTAPLLAAAATQFNGLVGIDISFRWLVVAKKRLLEAGLDTPLICCCAEVLPFPHSIFDYVASESVIENVRDQQLALKECNRVMKPAGHLFISTPNRFSLGPDPHTGILAGGYLPDAWTAALVRKQGGVPPLRRLLSKNSLNRLIREGGFRSIRLKIPFIAAEQRQHFSFLIRVAITIYGFAKRVPLITGLLLCVGPLFHAIAQKPNDIKLGT